MELMRQAIGKLVTIHFANGVTREVSNGNVYLFENGILKIVTDGKEEYHLPHTVNQVIFPATEKPKRSKATLA